MNHHDQDNELDPFDVRRLQPRARDVFARAARMQDLHGQAQAKALGGASGPAPSAQPLAFGTDAAALDVQRLLAHSAGHALGVTHHALHAAAQQARQAALTDPVIAKLNSRINGASPPDSPDQVVDVEARELPAALPAAPPPSA
jgi:hypothetical protein